MSEAHPEAEPYRMETDVIPAGVDITLAGQRSALIEKWRSGESDSAETYTELERLYWRNQSTADDATRFYLRETAYSFPVEANMDEDLTDSIYNKVQEEF